MLLGLIINKKKWIKRQRESKIKKANIRDQEIAKKLKIREEKTRERKF